MTTLQVTPKSFVFIPVSISLIRTGGTAVMTSLVRGMSLEVCTAMVVAVMGTYTFIGCLGATFYVSYFNTTAGWPRSGLD